LVGVTIRKARKARARKTQEADREIGGPGKPKSTVRSDCATLEMEKRNPSEGRPLQKAAASKPGKTSGLKA